MAKLGKKQLGQARASGTDPVSVYSPRVGIIAEIKGIIIANTTSLEVKYRLFVDRAGTRYDETTTIAWDTPIPGNATVHIDTSIVISLSTGNFAYRTNVANALTITIFGEESI